MTVCCVLRYESEEEYQIKQVRQRFHSMGRSGAPNAVEVSSFVLNTVYLYQMTMIDEGVD